MKKKKLANTLIQLLFMAEVQTVLFVCKLRPLNFLMFKTYSNNRMRVLVVMYFR